MNFNNYVYSFKCGNYGHFAKDCEEDNTDNEWGSAPRCYSACSITLNFLNIYPILVELILFFLKKLVPLVWKGIYFFNKIKIGFIEF